MIDEILFRDLPPECFPVHIEAIGPDDAIVWEGTIEPYVLTHVPPAPPHLRNKIRVRATFGDGQIVESGP